MQDSRARAPEPGKMPARALAFLINLECSTF
jgi:hypothetical protein